MPIYELAWFPFLVTFLIVYAKYLFEHYVWQAALLLFYIGGYSVFVAFNQQLGVIDYNFTLHLKYAALCVLVPLFSGLMVGKFPEWLAVVLGWVSVAWPICGNHSLTACLMLMFLATYGLRWGFVLPILVHPTALGLGGICLFLVNNLFGVWGYLFLIPLPLLYKYDFFSDSGRFHLWNQVWEWFWARSMWKFGFFPGSFTQYGPNIAESIAAPDQQTLYFVFVHNEVLQFLFEYGVVGVALALPLVWKLRRAEWFYMLCFVCFLNWPFRHGLFSLFLCSLILTYSQKKRCLSDL